MRRDQLGQATLATNELVLRVTDTREFANGHEFGSVGSYKRFIGRVQFAIDPQAEAQRGIVDLDKAPTGSDGRVRFDADFMLLQPADSERGNHRLLYDYANRGNKRALQFFNDAPHSNAPDTLADAGNGFLMRRGYAIVWLAWEGDILAGGDRLVLDLPTATDHGKRIIGTVRVEYIADRPGIVTYPLSGRVTARSYPATSLDTREAILTRRRYPYDQRQKVSPDQWSFARTVQGGGQETGTERAVIPSATDIYVPGGFEPGWIYELVYTASDPTVMGLGHVAVRDFISFLRYSAVDARGEHNPLRGIDKAYGWGRSQGGRCIRDFIYRGFNADALGRRVFDGVLPHVAGAGRKWLNHRFASPIVSGGQQYEDHFNIADSFPFSYAWSKDHITGNEDAILKRPDTDPLVIHTQTATEYWVRRGSLVHTDTRGHDLEQPTTVRVYFWASSQHFADPRLHSPSRSMGQNYPNVVATSMLFRAVLDAIDRWASDGAPPPASRIPSCAAGTLVDMPAWRAQFPEIPSIATPLSANGLPLLDFGPKSKDGILREPPTVIPGEGYTVLIPAVDSDGNDLGGVRAPMAAAPLGTYTGWNLRVRGYGHGAQFRFEGSYIPFSETSEERTMTRDPRRSILERYPDADAYAAAVTLAARDLVHEGLMLEEDVEGCAAAAANWGCGRHVVTLR